MECCQVGLPAHNVGGVDLCLQDVVGLQREPWTMAFEGLPQSEGGFKTLNFPICVHLCGVMHARSSSIWGHARSARLLMKASGLPDGMIHAGVARERTKETERTRERDIQCDPARMFIEIYIFVACLRFRIATRICAE